MPYKIEVTGENIQAVFQDVMNLAIVFGQGGNNAFRPPVTAPTPPLPEGVTQKDLDEATEMPPLGDARRPKQTEGVDTGEPAIETPKTLALKEDIQPRVRAIMDGWKERAEPGTAENVVTQGGVNYAVGLLAKFGAKSTKDLKLEQYADFMKASEAYLDGSAK